MLLSSPSPPRAYDQWYVVSRPTLSPSSTQVVLAARSCGASHAPPVQVLNCAPPTQSRCPSAHGPSSAVVPVGAAAGAVELGAAELGAATGLDAGDEEEDGAGTLDIGVAAAGGVAALGRDVAAAGDEAPVAEGRGPPPLFRGFPSQGCLNRPSWPLGRLTELPGYGYAMATC